MRVPFGGRSTDNITSFALSTAMQRCSAKLRCFARLIVRSRDVKSETHYACCSAKIADCQREQPGEG